MKKLSITCMALAAVFSFGQTAKAAPVSLALTLTTDSGVTLFISAIGGAISDVIPFDMSGTIDVTFDDAIDDPAGTNDTTSISFDDAAIDLSDEPLLLEFGFLGNVQGGFTGMGINTFSSNSPIPLTTSVASDPFEYTFDPGGGSPTELEIDEGLFTYIGTGALGVTHGSSLGFSIDPAAQTFVPVGQIGLVTQDMTLTGNTLVVDVVVSAPLSFTGAILTDPLALDTDFSGVLIATGSYTTIVPEPSAVVLLGIAAAGLIPLWRRLRR